MNALQAMSRLNILNNAVGPLESSIENLKSRGDYEGSSSLKIIFKELSQEKQELELKLSEVNL